MRSRQNVILAGMAILFLFALCGYQIHSLSSAVHFWKRETAKGGLRYELLRKYPVGTHRSDVIKTLTLDERSAVLITATPLHLTCYNTEPIRSEMKELGGDDVFVMNICFDNDDLVYNISGSAHRE